MNYRRLGGSGLALSELSFGSWVTFKNQLDETTASGIMGYAYDQGVNFFDNAEVYAGGEAEKLMGRVIRKLGWRRDSYCVSSKVFWGGDKPTQNGLSRKHVRDACHAALERFGLDYLDLFFCHRHDPNTPVAETVAAMSDLIRQGKVLYWGTSEWTARQLAEAFDAAHANGDYAPTMEQPQYNLFHRDRVEKELAPHYESHGLGTTVWSPLASGILTGKYNRGFPAGTRMSLPAFAWLKASLETPEGRAKIEKARRLETVAGDLGTTLTKLSLAWCLKNPRVSTVILGASSLDQLKENLAAGEIAAQLTPAVMEAIEGIVRDEPASIMRG